MNCEICDKKIPAARLKALPNTKTCVKCSHEDYKDESEFVSQELANDEV